MDINYVTPEQFPDDYKTWGDSGFRRINKLLDDAANLIKAKTKNTVIDYVGFSKVKSEKGKPVVFINCENLDRYYINEQDVRDFKLPKIIKSGL